MNKTISGLDDYVKTVIELNNTVHEREDDFTILSGKNLLFRGQANNAWKLMPTLGRLDYEINNECVATSEEKNMIEMAKNKMPDIFTNDLQPLELLALLQHHGMPTRLLDITENALVALYFACDDSEQSDKDGEVIIFRDNLKGVTNYPIIQAAADSYNICYGEDYPLSCFLDNALDQDYFKIQKSRVIRNRNVEEAKDKWVKGCFSKIMYV